MPALLALIPGILFTALKYLGPVVLQNKDTLTAILIKLLSKNSTAAEIIKTIQSVLGGPTQGATPMGEEKKKEFEMELQSLLGQIELEKLNAQNRSIFVSGARPFLFWGLSMALLMSVLVEPTLNYIVGFFGVTPPSIFVLSPDVIVTLSALCGIHQITRTIEKSKGIK